MSKDTLVKGGVIAAAVLLVGAYVVWWAGRSGGPAIADTVLMVDIQDGTLYAKKVGDRGWVLPAPNPDGERTLLPVSEAEDGRLVIPARYRSSANPELYNPEVVDAESGIVISPTNKPIPLG